MTRAPSEPRPGRSSAAALPLALAVPMLGFALAGCEAARTGPTFTLQNPDGHRVFLDGREAEAGTLPFRYYGATRWDALPDVPVENGVPTFDREPASAVVRVDVPASRWLFPFDLPIEVFDRVVHGRRDQAARVTIEPKPAELRVVEEISREQLGRLSTRGLAARVAR